jgi:hypothetical protein
MYALCTGCLITIDRELEDDVTCTNCGSEVEFTETPRLRIAELQGEAFERGRRRVARPPEPAPELPRAQGLSERVMTIEAVSRRLGCKRSTIFRLLSERKLHRGKGPGRGTVITTASVERYERERLAPEPRARRKHEAPSPAGRVVDHRALAAELRAQRRQLLGG